MIWITRNTLLLREVVLVLWEIVQELRLLNIAVHRNTISSWTGMGGDMADTADKGKEIAHMEIDKTLKRDEKSVAGRKERTGVSDL